MKRLLLVLMLILGAVMITSRPVATYAYTDEEKQQAKSWLSSHGYPPTRAGAEQAYQDYMDGKIDAIVDGGPCAVGAKEHVKNAMLK